MAPMDYKTLRKLNIRLLELEVGSLTALAKLANTSQSYLSQCVGPKAIRTVGDDIARRLEVSTGKPRGWLDEPHTDEAYMNLARAVYDKLIMLGSHPKLQAVAVLLDVPFDVEELQLSGQEARANSGANHKDKGRVITLEDNGSQKKRRGQ